MNKRIDYLSNFIKKANYVIDIGCDHGYLSVLLLKKEIANHVINIDINKKPLDSAISNLTKNNLLDKTTNIINDGLKNLNFDFVIDYCFISGLGSKTIINIIENNENIIENFILQTNTNSLDLRKYLLKNNFEIISEDKIVDNNIWYEVILAKKTNKNFLDCFSISEIYFGKIEHHLSLDNFKKFINFKYEKNYKKQSDKISFKLKEELKIIEKVYNEYSKDN